MKNRSRVVTLAVDHPLRVVAVAAAAAVGFILVAGLPSLWPGAFPFLAAVRVDTDPENMLPHDEPVRVFHDRMKRQLALYDMVVVGVAVEHGQRLQSPFPDELQDLGRRGTGVDHHRLF